MAHIIHVESGEIHLWYASLQSSSQDRERYRALLSPQEIERAEKLRFQESQHSFITSRGLVRKILSNYTGIPPGNLTIAYRATGKPYLPHSQVQFNISHTNRFLICAITFNHPIGVDYQVMYDITNRDTLVRSFFSPHEQQHYEKLQGEEALEYFFETWVRKEAYMKATGLGFHLPSRRFSICSENGEDPFLRSDHEQFLPLDAWSIKDLALQPGYKGALAIKGEIEDIKHFQTNL